MTSQSQGKLKKSHPHRDDWKPTTQGLSHRTEELTEEQHGSGKTPQAEGTPSPVAASTGSGEEPPITHIAGGRSSAIPASGIRDETDPAGAGKRSAPPGLKKFSLAAVFAACAVLLTATNLRSAVSVFPPIADIISGSLGASPLFIGVVGMAPTAMFALAAWVSGPLSRKMTFRAVTATAMVVAAAGFGVRAVATDELVFLIATMVGLAGVGITNTLLPAVIKDYFPSRLTIMSILYLVVGQLSMATASVVAVPLEHWGGWRVALGVWAIPPALAVLFWIIMYLWVTPGSVLQRHRSLIQAVRPRKFVQVLRPGGQPTGARTYGHMWRNPVSWGVVLMFAMTSSTSYCFITWAPKMVVTGGGSPQLGGIVGGVFAVVGMVTSVIIPWFVNRFRAGSLIATWICALTLAAALILLLVDPGVWPILWITMVAIGCSTFQLALILVTTRTREAGAAAALSSRAQGIGYTVACAGPFIYGWLFDHTGSWNAGLGMLLGFNVVLLAAGIIASRNVFVDDTPRAAT